MIADFTNFNVVTSDTVTGSVTLRLKDVPWDQALDIILQTQGPGRAQERQRALDRAEGRTRRPRRSSTSSRAADRRARAGAHPVVPAQLHQGRGRRQEARWHATAQAARRILSPRGSVIFEARTNQLFVSDIPSKLEEVQAADRQDRHPGAPGADRGAHRRGRRQLRPQPGRQARLSTRTVSGGTPGYGVGGNDASAVGGNYAGGRRADRPDATTGAAASIRDTQFVNLPANTGVAGGAAGGHVRAVAVQRVGQTVPEPRAVRAGSRRQGQDHLQPARDHRRPDRRR